MRYELNEADRTEVDDLLHSVLREHQSVEEVEFLEQAAVYSHMLPRRLVKIVEFWRFHEPSAAMLIHGLPIESDLLARTPDHWRAARDFGIARREEFLVALLASLVGDIFGWATQQEGRLIHDILPIAEHVDEQLGSGSKELLAWHTEDAFHPLRGDYLTLLCLRNPDHVATTISSRQNLDLSKLDRESLHGEHFVIRPDESHLPKNNNARQADDLTRKAEEFIQRLNRGDQQVSVLFGSESSPYLRLDPYFMEEPSDQRASEALQGLIGQLEAGQEDIILQPGDCLIVDNFQAVHGRRPFTARFDGSDRWLKRANVARDIRKSRNVRRTAASRIIH